MSVQVRRRRETAAYLATFVGAQGELLVDTTSNRVQVRDGTTPGGFPAAKLSEVVANTRTAVADANYTALATDRTVAFTSLTTPRTVTLPAASAYPTGTQLLVVDESGACSATNTLTLARAGTDTVNGAASAALSAAYGYVALASNGASKWTIVDQAAAGVASGTFSPTATFAISGDLSVAYTAQNGTFYQVGKLVFTSINLVFTATYTTASGALRVSLPSTVAAGVTGPLQVLQLTGSTAVTWPSSASMLYAQAVAGQAYANLYGAKSGAAPVAVNTAQIVSGNSVTLTLAGVFVTG